MQRHSFFFFALSALYLLPPTHPHPPRQPMDFLVAALQVPRALCAAALGLGVFSFIFKVRASTVGKKMESDIRRCCTAPRALSSPWRALPRTRPPCPFDGLAIH